MVTDSEPRVASPGMRPGTTWRAYAGTLLIVAGCTALAGPMRRHFDLSNLTMLYLLGVVIAAIAFGRGPAIVAAIAGVAVFDFAFVPPQFTLRVADTQYLVTFAVMLVVAVITGTLTARLREQREAARLRERRAAALYGLSHDLAVRSSATEVLEAAVQRIADLIGAPVAALRPAADGCLAVAAGSAEVLGSESEWRAARQTYETGRVPGLLAGPGESEALHFPLVAGVSILGVLSARPPEPPDRRDSERLDLLRALASQTALALERCRLAEDAQRAQTQADTERARSALLSSVSHDLRTPLAAITGAASSLHGDAGDLSDATRRDLAETIAEGARRLNRVIGNLLDMTRLESKTFCVRKEWHSLEEIVGAALALLEPDLGRREVRLSLPDDLPLIPLDDVLFEQVVRNLVENAHKYSPPEEAIEIRASAGAGHLDFEVADRGPGLEPGEETRVFDKFYRGRGGIGRPGVGLGLAICKGIVEAHAGTIVGRNRPGGGAVFTVRLPLEGPPPTVEVEPPEGTALERSE